MNDVASIGNGVPPLEARRVSKWFGEVIAVNDCSLTVQPGVTGLLGLNGAGKTTLFKLLSGLIESSQGQVLLRGKRLRREVGLFRRIGFCPESDALPDWLTGNEFVQLMLRLMGFSGDEVRERHLIQLEPHDRQRQREQPHGHCRYWNGGQSKRAGPGRQQRHL